MRKFSLLILLAALSGIARTGPPDTDFRRFLRDVQLDQAYAGPIDYLSDQGTDSFRGRVYRTYAGSLGQLSLLVKVEPYSKMVYWLEVRCPGNRFDAWRPIVTSVMRDANQTVHYCDDTRSRSIVWRSLDKRMAEVSTRDYTYFRMVDESFFERVCALCEPKPSETPIIVIPRE